MAQRSTDAPRPPARPGNGAAHIAANGAGLPLSFEPNRGQAAEAVRALARGRGYTLFLPAPGALLALESPASENPLSPTAEPGPAARPAPKAARLQLVGADPAAEVAGPAELPWVVNDFIGDDPSQWHTGIPTYARVKVEEAWPGVDLVYYGNQRQLEVDFVVAPSADPRAIALRMSGDELLTLDAAGDLPLGATGLSLARPALYQEAGGAREQMEGGYVLEKDGLMRFRVPAHDAASLCRTGRPAPCTG